MTLTAFFVGLCFGFTGYHFFVAPYVLKQGLRMGMLLAAQDIKGWLLSVSPEFKSEVESSLMKYNMDRKLQILLKKLASDVAPPSKQAK